ncbi:unnamed protein product [Sphagnum balticum]
MPRTQDGQDIFDVYRCSGCLKGYGSMYRQLYYKDGIILLAEAIRLGDYYVVKYHQPTSAGAKFHHTIISKDILGIIDPDNHDFEPLSFNRPVCEVERLVDLPLHDPEATLHKLSLITIFS